MNEYSTAAFKKIFLNNSTKAPESVKSMPTEATYLRLTVVREQKKTVDLRFPAASARWIIDLIPDDILEKIKVSGVSIEEIQNKLIKSEKLVPQKLFSLEEPDRTITVWLE